MSNEKKKISSVQPNKWCICGSVPSAVHHVKGLRIQTMEKPRMGMILFGVLKAELSMYWGLRENSTVLCSSYCWHVTNRTQTEWLSATAIPEAETVRLASLEAQGPRTGAPAPLWQPTQGDPESGQAPRTNSWHTESVRGHDRTVVFRRLSVRA